MSATPILDRRFGVEIECFGPVSNPQLDTNVKANATLHHGNWFVKSDGTICPDSSKNYPTEIVSPILKGTEGLADVNIICELLKKYDFSANNSCGLHVHVDGKDLNLKTVVNVLKKYAEFEHLIDPWIKEYRRKNNSSTCGSAIYAAATMTNNLKDFETLKNVGFAEMAKGIAWSLSRYCKVNLAALHRHGSIEFRHHHGTVDPVEINSWIIFCVNFVENVRLFTQNPEKFPLPAITKPVWPRPLVPVLLNTNPSIDPLVSVQVA